MTNNLSLFNFDSHEVRIVMVKGEFLFVGKDVALALGYSDPTTAIHSHCRGVQKLHPILDALGLTQEVRVLTEPDVLRLVISSKLPEAQKFEAWVFEEVLPSIRKTDLDEALEAQRRSKDSVSAIAARNALALRDQGYSDERAVALANVAAWSINRANGYVNATRLGEALEDSAEFDDYKVTPVIMNKILSLAGLQAKDGVDWLATEAGEPYSEPKEYSAIGATTSKCLVWRLDDTCDKLLGVNFPGNRTLYDVIKEENTKPKTLYTNQWAALLYPDTPNNRFQQTKELTLRLWQAGFIEKGMYGVITATELAAGVCVQEGPKSIKWDVDAAMAALLLEEDLREAEFQARPMPKVFSVC